MQLRLRARIDAHTGPVYALSPGHEKGLLLSGGSDRYVLSHYTEDGNPGALKFLLPTKVYSIGLDSETGHYFFGNGQGQVHVVDHEQRKELRCLQLHEGAVFSMLISEGRIFTGAEDGIIHIMDSSGRGTRVETGVRTKIRMLRASADGETIYACLGNGELLLLNRAGKLIARVMLHEGSCNAVQELHTDYLITGGKDGQIMVLNRKTMKTEHSFPAHYWAIYDFALAPGGEFVCSGSRDKTMKIWQSSNLGFVQKLSRENEQGPQYSINRLYWDSYSGHLLSAGDDRAMFVWEKA